MHHEGDDEMTVLKRARSISLAVIAGLVLTLTYGMTASCPAAEQKRPGILDLIRRYQTQTTSPAPQQAERVVHFPPDKDLGLLKTIEASKGHPSIVNTDFDYRVLGAAKGDVAVPAGRRLVLFVNEKTLRNLQSLSTLKPDDLYGVHLSGSYSGGPKLGDNHLAPLAALTGLKQLALANTNVTQRGIQHLLGLKDLNYLEISSMALDDGALPYIAEISSIETLVLGSPVTDEGLRHLAPLKNLKELFLWVENIRGPGLRHLAQLPNLRYLQVKDVDEKGRYGFGDSALQYIKDVPSLRHLRIWPNLPITVAGIAHLAQCPQLEKLELGKLPVTDRNLSQLQALPRLKSLDASGGESKVSDAGMVYVGQMKQLESISLPSTISDAGAAKLAGLTRLKCLYIGGPITDAGLGYVAGLRNLEELTLWCDQITDAGIERIATLTKLKVLHIGNCQMTNAGLARLAELKSLEKLTIRKSNITLAGLNQLNSLVNLRELVVYGPAPDAAARCRI
jgi:Leucine-rich repeat (LRR) protein